VFESRGIKAVAAPVPRCDALQPATATACKEDIDAVEGPSRKSYSLRV
jgi:hypothetical protein